MHEQVRHGVKVAGFRAWFEAERGTSAMIAITMALSMQFRIRWS